MTNLTENFNDYEESGGKKKDAKKFFSCTWKPITLSQKNLDSPVIFKCPPDPLHVNLLGPINDCIEKMESLYPEEMENFLKRHNISKSGQGPGGQLNGPSIKTILKETNLNELESLLPEEAEHFISYMRSIRELHRICIADELDPDFNLVIQNVQENFDYLYENFGLNMTLKTHVILHHYGFYFSITGKTLKDTNGEYVEALHNTLRIHEDVHRYKVVRKIGTEGHIKKSHKSLSTLNVRMAGFSPSENFTLRRSSPHSPAQSPLLRRT